MSKRWCAAASLIERSFVYSDNKSYTAILFLVFLLSIVRISA
jgi:hypothetical protein